MKPLPVPPEALRDPDAVQMLSAWIAEKGLRCSIKIGMWEANGTDELRAWGVLLADVVRHIANAHREEFGRDPERSVDTVLGAIVEELGEPTSRASGGFHEGAN